VEASPSTWNFGSYWFRWSENADFQSILAHAASAVTPEKINTNRKSIARFPMSLMSIVCCHKPPKGGSKTQKAVFRIKLHFTWRKPAIKFLCVNTVSIVRHSLTYLCAQKWFAGDVLCYLKIWPKLTTLFKNADFQSIFACSASAVTPSRKSSINTHRNKSTTCFPMT